MLGTVLVIRPMVPALCRGMLDQQFDVIRGTDVKDLCQMAIDENDGVEIFTHGSCPGYLH
jgi:hypothetical protein